MKLNIFLLLKMSLGFIMGMLIAMLFNLPYFFTAGVIAVLSLEPTRKRSIDVGTSRVFASLLSLGLASLLFYIFGFEIWVLFLFVTLFIPLTFAFKIDKGIVVSLVLVSQIYLEKDFLYSLNALYVFIIGLGVALILNLYMPKNHYIKQEIEDIDTLIDDVIQKIAHNDMVTFTFLDEKLKQTYKNIQVELENLNIPLTTKRLKYIEMRSEQVNSLKRIHHILLSVDTLKEKDIILDFLKRFDKKIGKENYAMPLSRELKDLFSLFSKSNLPETREVFEKRAQLYYVLLEIDQFLNLKLLYHQSIELNIS